MSVVHEAEKNWPYYVEVEKYRSPDNSEIERGRRFAKGLGLMWDGLFNQARAGDGFRDDTLDDLQISFEVSSLNRTRLLVLPAYPFEREIVRGDPFYEWVSPHEKTTSDTPLVISRLELVKSTREPALKPQVKVISPSYKGLGRPLQEESLIFLGDHCVAIQNR